MYKEHDAGLRQKFYGNTMWMEARKGAQKARWVSSDLHSNVLEIDNRLVNSNCIERLAMTTSVAAMGAAMVLIRASVAVSMENGGPQGAIMVGPQTLGPLEPTTRLSSDSSTSLKFSSLSINDVEEYEFL